MTAAKNHELLFVGQLAEWLTADDGIAEIAKLDDWLLGRDMPQTSREADAYQSFVAMLDRASVPNQYEILARRLGRWFDGMTDPMTETASLDEIIRMDTALRLARNLQYPEHLGAPLGRLYGAGTDVMPRIAPELEHMGFRLLQRLRDAVIVNQVDRSHLDHWRELAGSDPRRSGVGAYRAAVRGVCAMPLSSDRRNERDVDAVAEILALAAKSLDGVTGKGKTFYELVTLAQRRLRIAGLSDIEVILARYFIEVHRMPQWASILLDMQAYIVEENGEECLKFPRFFVEDTGNSYGNCAGSVCSIPKSSIVSGMDIYVVRDKIGRQWIEMFGDVALEDNSHDKYKIGAAKAVVVVTLNFALGFDSEYINKAA